MSPYTRMSLVMLVMACTTGGGGMVLVRHAHAMPPPAEPTYRTLQGTVIEFQAQPCRRRGQVTGTCFKPVVAYDDAGQAQQVTTRTWYRSLSEKKGDPSEVLILNDGTAWIAREWKTNQAERQRDFESKRDFPLWMGWILVGCGGFALLLSAGLVFWVDRSDEQPAGPRATSAAP